MGCAHEEGVLIMSEVASLPMEVCEECHQLRPSIGFVGLGIGYKSLCSSCYNRSYMQRLGLPELETVDFEPITRRDVRGLLRRFYFVVHMSTGLQIDAFEWVDGEPGGYRCSVLEHPTTPVRAAYDRLVRKIERGLAEQYLVPADSTEPDKGGLHMAGDAINGRIEERDGQPRVVVDGRELTWEELGRSLSPHTGLTFRLECFESHEDPPITAHPARPHTLWWLVRFEDEHAETEEEFRPH
jgi:hypothetical protein